MNDGQHRDSGSGAPGESRGQRSKLEQGAYVGQKNGPDANMRVRPTRCDADISTTSKSGGDGPNLKHNGYRSDDKR